MILSAHQPCYLPYMGYFNKVINSDIFVILDDVNFEKGSYINRTKIKTAQGEHWLTIPVPRDSHKKKIKDVFDSSSEWRVNHDKTVIHNYKRCEFDDVWYIMTELSNNVSFINCDFIEQMNEVLGIDTEMHIQPDVEGTKQDLIINLCKHYNADAFLFGCKGRDYVDVHYFEAHGVTPLFQDFECIEYPQQWGGPFVPGLSIIDALFNVGPEKTMDLIKGGYAIPQKYL